MDGLDNLCRLLLQPKESGVERVNSIYEDVGDGNRSFQNAVVGGLGISAVSQDCAKDAPQMILDSESCGYHL